MIGSLKKVPYTKDTKKPFVCITGYNDMATPILEGSIIDFPPYMALKQKIALNSESSSNLL